MSKSVQLSEKRGSCLRCRSPDPEKSHHILDSPLHEVGSWSLFLPGLWHGPVVSHRDTIITQSNRNTSALSDHSAGFITASFTHQMHKSLPVHPPNTACGSPPPLQFGPVSHAPYCLFNLSPNFSPSHPSFCLACTMGQRTALHVLPRFAFMKRLCTGKCTGIKERKEAYTISSTPLQSRCPSICADHSYSCVSLLFFFFWSSHLLFLW